MKIKHNKWIIFGSVSLVVILFLALYTMAFQNLGKIILPEQPKDRKLVECKLTVANPKFFDSKIEYVECSSTLVSRLECPVGYALNPMTWFSDYLTLKMFAESQQASSLTFLINEGARKSFNTIFCVSQYAPNLRFELLYQGEIVNDKVVDI